jgi:hypothetical protein
VSGDAVHQPTWPLLLKIEHMVKLQVLGNNSKTVNNINEIEVIVNLDLSKMYNWSKEWPVDFNPRKTECIIFSTNQAANKPSNTTQFLQQIPCIQNDGVNYESSLCYNKPHGNKLWRTSWLFDV